MHLLVTTTIPGFPDSTFSSIFPPAGPAGEDDSIDLNESIHAIEPAMPAITELIPGHISNERKIGELPKLGQGCSKHFS